MSNLPANPYDRTVIVEPDTDNPDRAPLAGTGRNFVVSLLPETTPGRAVKFLNAAGEWISFSTTDSPSWGNIIGDIADQADLMAELLEKPDATAISAVGYSGNYTDLSNRPVFGDLAFINKNSSTSQFLRGDGTWSIPVDVNAQWGSIAGNISAQTDLMDQLSLKAPVISPAFQGNPRSTTPPAVDNSSDSLATTAWFFGQAFNGAPVMNGVASSGDSTRWARGNHRHPTDTTLAPIDSPLFTGNARAPTVAYPNNTVSIATTAFVTAALAGFGGLADAPVDGKQYARKNATWTEVASASGATAEWNYINTTAPPPSSGQLRLNNATQTAATAFYISTTTAQAVDVTRYLMDVIGVGTQLLIQDRDDSTKWQQYEVTGAPVNNTTYVTIPVLWKKGGTAVSQQRLVVWNVAGTAAAGGGGTALDALTPATANDANLIGFKPAAGSGKAINIAAGDAATIAAGGTAGGALNLSAGAPGAAGSAGGAISILSGAATTTGPSGTLTIQGGSTAAGGAAGLVKVQGSTGASATAGPVTIAGGAAGAAATSVGGLLTLSGGANGATTGSRGGSVVIAAPDSVGGLGATVSLTGGAGGNASFGNGHLGGGISLLAGAGGNNTNTFSAGIGGAITLTAGAGGTPQSGTSVAGDGGAVNLRAGAGGGTVGPGGNVSIQPGAPAGTGARGNIQLDGGRGAALATNATGGFVTTPTCAGTPTGVPANVPVGSVATILDTTGSKLWFYVGGAWKGVVVA